MDANNESDALEQAVLQMESFLVANHMRRTPERVAILKRVYRIKKSFTADEIHQRILPQFHVSLTTIYNTLEILVKCNLIARHEIENQPARYQRIFENQSRQYIHLVCVQCGKVTEHKDVYLAHLLKNRPLRGFKALYPSFFVYGLCTKCLREQKKLQRDVPANLKISPAAVPFVKKKKL